MTTRQQRALIALRKATADDPRMVASACGWCGVTARAGEGDVAESEISAKQARALFGRGVVPAGATRRIRFPGQEVYTMPEWRRCKICAATARMSNDLAFAYAALDIITNRTLPLRRGKAADELGAELAASGDLVLYALRGDANDPGNDRPWANLDEAVVARWKLRYAALRAVHAPASEGPCRTCGTTIATDWVALAHTGRVCAACDTAAGAYSGRIITTLLDWAASKAAGLGHVAPGLGAYVEMTLAHDHPDYETDGAREPWAYLNPKDREGLAVLAVKLAAETAKAEADAKAAAERRRSGRLRVPA